MGTKPNLKPSHPWNQVVDASNRSTGKKTAICSPTKHVRVLKESFKAVRVLVQIELELGRDLEVLIFELRPKIEKPWSKGENKQPTHSTYGVGVDAEI